MRLRRWGMAAWLAMAAVLYLFENNTVTRALLIGSLLMPVLSCVMAMLSRHAVLSMEAPEACMQGSACNIMLRSIHHLPMTVAMAEISCLNSFTGEEETFVTMLTNGQACLEMTPAHAGMLTLRVEGAVTDWLGLMRRKSEAQESTLLIRPILPESESIDVAGFSDEGSQKGSMACADERGAEVREYQPGDPVRSIHWKLSQKLDKLMIRLPDAQYASETLLALDASGTSKDAEQLDLLGRRFLAMSHHMQSAEQPHRAIWLDRSGEQQMVRVMSADDIERLMIQLYQTGVDGTQAPFLPENAVICKQ